MAMHDHLNDNENPNNCTNCNIIPVAVTIVTIISTPITTLMTMTIQDHNNDNDNTIDNEKNDNHALLVLLLAGDTTHEYRARYMAHDTQYTIHWHCLVLIPPWSGSIR